MAKSLCFAYGHPEGGTIDIINNKCLFEGCDQNPAFGLEWIKVFAYGHPEGGTIDVVNKKCLFEGCDKSSAFSLGWKKAFATHNLCRRVVISVLNKKCLKTIIRS